MSSDGFIHNAMHHSSTCKSILYLEGLSQVYIWSGVQSQPVWFWPLTRFVLDLPEASRTQSARPSLFCLQTTPHILHSISTQYWTCHQSYN